MKNKKIVLIIFVVLLFFLSFNVIYSNIINGGIRGGDVFKESPEEAQIDFIRSNDTNAASEVTMVIEPIHCYDNYYLVVFHDENRNIYTTVLEKRQDKYTVVYGFEFEQNEIDRETASKAYSAFRKSDLVFSVMPKEVSNVIINNEIDGTVVSFNIEDNEYKLWYALVDGGVDSVHTVSLK